MVQVNRLFVESCPERLTAVKASVDAHDGNAIRAAAHLAAATATWRRLSAEASKVGQPCGR